MKKLPLLPTFIVAVAVAVMIALGIWQLQRRTEKEEALARYAAAQGLPPIAWPAAVDPNDPPLFRRSEVRCDSVVGWRAVSGRNLAGDAGWVHIASCGVGTGLANLVMGWSTTPDPPVWRGGAVTGFIGTDPDQGVRLIAANPAPGLQPARPPSLDDVPNNHLAYAAQWFFFAAAAAVIYILALRRRSR